MYWCKHSVAMLCRVLAFGSATALVLSGGTRVDAAPEQVGCYENDSCDLRHGSDGLPRKFRVNMQRSTRYYDISGNTSTEIWNELRGESNPLEELPRVGRKPFGNASLAYSYKYQPKYDPVLSGCTVMSGEIEVRLEIVLPRLKDFDHKPERLQAKWESFQSIIIEHEVGHLEILQRMATLLPGALDRAGESSCAEMDRQIEAAVRHLATAIQRDSSHYDARPEHELASSW